MEQKQCMSPSLHVLKKCACVRVTGCTCVRAYVRLLQFDCVQESLKWLLYLDSYRNAYQAIRHLKTTSASSDELIDHIKTFNLYIVDMCDTLWRSRAFSGSEKPPQSVFHHLSPIPQSSQMFMKHSFSLSQHPAMLGLAVKFLIEVRPMFQCIDNWSRQLHNGSGQ